MRAEPTQPWKVSSGGQVGTDTRFLVLSAPSFGQRTNFQRTVPITFCLRIVKRGRGNRISCLASHYDGIVLLLVIHWRNLCTVKKRRGKKERERERKKKKALKE